MSEPDEVLVELAEQSARQAAAIQALAPPAELVEELAKQSARQAAAIVKALQAGQ